MHPPENIPHHRRWIQTAYVIIDVVGLWVILFLLFYIRIGTKHSNSFSHFLHSDYLTICVIQTFFFPLLLGYYGLYGTSRGKKYHEEWLKVGKATFIATLATLAVTTFLKIEGLSRLILILGFVLDFIYLITWRTLKRRVVQKWVSEGYNNERTLIIGADEIGRHLARSLATRPELGVKVVGFLDDRKEGSEILGKLSEFRTIARSQFIDSVYITLPSHRDAVKQLLQEAKREGISFRIVPELYDLAPTQISIAEVDGLPCLTVNESPIPIGGLFVKRLIDVLGAAVALLVLSFPLLIFSLLIKLDSKGPVLYKGVRVGYKGKQFRCYKFRTMTENAEDLKENLSDLNKRLGPFFKVENDPRVTSVGRFMRRYSIDEIMQLLNVIKGDMSLVGPRPPTPDEVQKYQPHQLRRLNVRPGMTGLWQVRARSNPSFDIALRYDLFYIDHWSLRLDFWILLQTVPAVLRGEGE